MIPIEYPSTLPVPQISVVAPVDRRQVSAQDRPRQARALQRDRLQIEQLQFPPMQEAEFAAFRDWWMSDLIFGGSWFAARWPLPQGMVQAVRRFVGTPSWSYVPGGLWSISAQCEVRGRGELPMLPPETLLLMHFDGDFTDEVGRVFTVAEGWSLPTFATGAPGFGQMATFSGTQAIKNATTETDMPWDPPALQVDMFVTAAPGDYTTRTMLAISRDALPFQVAVLRIELGAGGRDVRCRVRNTDGSSITVAEVSTNSRVIDAGLRTHLRLTIGDGVANQYHDGVLVATSALSISGDVPGYGITRVTVGAAPNGIDTGLTAYFAFMVGSIDELRITSEITDLGEFVTPSFPFTL